MINQWVQDPGHQLGSRGGSRRKNQWVKGPGHQPSSQGDSTTSGSRVRGFSRAAGKAAGGA